jgi:hypothetical protein
MSWLSKTAGEARNNIVTEKQKAEDRLERVLQQFATLTPMVRNCLKDLGDECFGKLFGIPFYHYGQTCDKNLDGSHCWYVFKKFGEMSSAAVNVRLMGQHNNAQHKAVYYFELQGTGIITKDISEQELKEALKKCLPWLLRDIQRFQNEKTSD